MEMRKKLAKKINVISEINILKSDSKIFSEIGKFHQAKEWLEEAILNSLQVNYDFDCIVEMIIEIVEIFELIDENEKGIELLNTICKIEAFSNNTPIMIMKAKLTKDVDVQKKIYYKMIDNGFWNENVIWRMVQLYWYDNDQRWIDEYFHVLSSENTSMIHVLGLLKELQMNSKNISNLLYKIEKILNMELCEEASNLLCEGFLYLNIYAYIKECNIKLHGWLELYVEMINQNWKASESLIISLKNESNSYILESVIVDTLSDNQTNLSSSFEMISNMINKTHLWRLMNEQLKCHDKKKSEDNLYKYLIKGARNNYYNSGLWNFDGEWFREMVVIWKILNNYNEDDSNKIELIGLCEICQKNTNVQDWEDILQKIEKRIIEMENFLYLFKTSFLNIIFMRREKNKHIEIFIDMNKEEDEIIKQNGNPIFYVNILFKYLKEEINFGRLLKWNSSYYDCSTFINYPIKGNVENYTKTLVNYYDSFDSRNITMIWLGKYNKVGVFIDEPQKNVDIVKKLINNSCDLYIDNNIFNIKLLDNLQYLDFLLIKTNEIVPKTIIEKVNRTIIFDDDVDEEDIYQFYISRKLPSKLINKVYIYGDISGDTHHHEMSLNLTEKYISISDNIDEMTELMKQTTVEKRLKLKELFQSFDIQKKYRRKSRRRGKDRGSKFLQSARNSYNFGDSDTESGRRNYCSEGDERKSVLSNTFSQISITFSEKDLEEIEGESGAKIMSIDMEFDRNFSLYESPKDITE
uniref:TPR_REGION domain-containing protein n=1 Tax=Strongyloides papillosus TaxID=174720 RepID=A0A0N5BT40_STREA